MRTAVIAIVVILVVFGAWVFTYPSASDPKNMRYVLWKVGIYSMDRDVATETMIGDPRRDALVLGKTKRQLRDKFGYLALPADASPFLRSCHQSSPWKDKNVLFIRKSPWMVVFDGDTATNLILVKGC